MANGDSRAARRSAATTRASGVAPGGDLRNTRGSYLLPLIAGLLLVAVIAGVSAATPNAVGTGGPWYRDARTLGLVLEVALVLLFAAVWTLGRRSPRRGYPVLALRRALRRVIAFAIIVVAALLVINSLHPHFGTTKRVKAIIKPKRLRMPRTRHPVKFVGAPLHAPWLPYVLLALLAVIVVVAAFAIATRRRMHRAFAAFDGEFLEDADELQRAVESGRSALRDVDDARAAIIACYLAMEGSLEGAGTARAAAETPDELLERAVAVGLVHGAAARRLTTLFYEARYSTHPLPPSARDSARQALDELSAELAGRPVHAGQVP